MTGLRVRTGCIAPGCRMTEVHSIISGLSSIYYTPVICHNFSAYNEPITIYNSDFFSIASVVSIDHNTEMTSLSIEVIHLVKVQIAHMKRSI